MAGLVMTLGDLAKRAHVVTPNVATMSLLTQKTIGQIMVSDIKERFRTGTTPDGSPWRPLKFARPTGGDKPLQDTGRLQASFSAETTPTAITVGTNHPGAGLLNFGGTVVPVRAKFLAIPLTKEARRAGSPRNMRGTKQMPLFARLVGGQWIGHFLLTKKAVIPPREFMGLSPKAVDTIAHVLLDEAARQYAEAGG